MATRGVVIALCACTLVALSAAAEDEVLHGLCPGTGYMNVGWGGMTREGCLARAYEVQQDTSQCAFVSYSASAGPQAATDFCRCFQTCSSPLEEPEGEVWESMRPSAQSAGSALPLVIGIVVVILLLCVSIVALFCYCRRRKAPTPASSNEATAAASSQIVQGRIVAEGQQIV